MTPRPPLDELLALFRATVAAEGITTGAGAGAGNSIIDAGLIGVGANSFISMLAVLYPGDPRQVDSKDITAFNNVTGEVTLAGAYKGVAAAIPVGVPYKIVTFRFVPAEVAAIAAALGTHDVDIKALLATIAGYLDTEIAAIITSQGRQLFTMDFWSLPQEEVALTIAAGDKALPSVTVADLPGGATIVRAIAMFKFRMVENHTYAGENSLDGAQVIQVAASVDAINFVTGQFTLAQDTREGGDVVIGLIDISGTVNANGAYAFHWDLAKAVQTGINFNDVQMGIRIWYSV